MMIFCFSASAAGCAVGTADTALTASFSLDYVGNGTAYDKDYRGNRDNFGKHKITL